MDSKVKSLVNIIEGYFTSKALKRICINCKHYRLQAWALAFNDENAEIHTCWAKYKGEIDYVTGKPKKYDPPLCEFKNKKGDCKDYE